MKQMKNWLFAIVFASVIGGTALTTLAPQTTLAAAGDPCPSGNILTIPPWYKGLQVQDPSTATQPNCADTKRLKGPNDVGGLTNYIWKIVLNIIEIMLQLVGYISVAFIIYGGFIFMTAGGSDGAAKGRTTLLNAIIGLVISIASVAIVNLVTGFIK
jgi:hypothetical protein